MGGHPPEIATPNHTNSRGGSRLKGFIVGLALTILIGQVPKFLGVPKSEGDFFEQAWGLITHLGDIQWLTTFVGAVSLAGQVTVGRKRQPPWPRPVATAHG